MFNENFNQGRSVSGGGIYIAGEPGLVGELTPGSGSLIVEANLVQGNSSGAGNGGGMRLERINGDDIRIQGGGNNTRVVVDHEIGIYDNMIVNNVAAAAGGGISLQDALAVQIMHNTIANNDSTATAGVTFLNDPNQSNPQEGAGIASHYNSTDLPVGTPLFSSPEMVNNILWHNRMFFFLIEDGIGDASIFGLCPDIGGTTIGLDCGLLSGNDPVYDDLGVIGGAGTLTCDNCLVTDDAIDPEFIQESINGNRTSAVLPEVTTAIQAPPAFDEGGNFIRLRYGPLLINSDYHIDSDSPAIDEGDDLTEDVPELEDDFDGEVRPSGDDVDIGADEVQE